MERGPFGSVITRVCAERADTRQPRGEGLVSRLSRRPAWRVSPVPRGAGRSQPFLRNSGGAVGSCALFHAEWLLDLKPLESNRWLRPRAEVLWQQGLSNLPPLYRGRPAVPRALSGARDSFDFSPVWRGVHRRTARHRGRVVARRRTRILSALSPVPFPCDAAPEPERASLCRADLSGLVRRATI